MQANKPSSVLMTIYLSILSPVCLCDLPWTTAGNCIKGSSWSCSKWGLHNILLPIHYVSSYLTLSSLPRSRRFTFCCTFLKVAFTGRYPAFCPAELGLSSHLICAVKWLAYFIVIKIIHFIFIIVKKNNNKYVFK